MGNRSSTPYNSKAKGGKAATVASTEPKHVPKQRKPSTTKAEVRLGEYPDHQQHGEKPLLDDDTFAKYIQGARQKLKKSFTNVRRRHHEEQRNPAPAPAPAPAPDHHVANVNSSNKNNERDEFFYFIQKGRKKLITVTTMGKNNPFKKGKESGH